MRGQILNESGAAEDNRDADDDGHSERPVHATRHEGEPDRDHGDGGDSDANRAGDRANDSLQEGRHAREFLGRTGVCGQKRD